MAGPDPTGSEGQRLEALAKQMADLERQSDDLQSAMQRSAAVRRLLVLVVVALLGIYMYLFYTTAQSFTNEENMDKLMKELERAAANNTDEVLRHAQELVEDTWPTVSAAMQDQFEKDMPTFMNLLGTERENLAVNLQSRMESVIRGKYEKALDQHRTILAEQFPSVKDERDMEIMADNFKDAFGPLVKRHYGDKIRSEFNRMYKIWDDFPLDDSRRSRDELSEELYRLLFALMQHKLATVGEDTAAAKPKSVPPEIPSSSESSSSSSGEEE